MRRLTRYLLPGPLLGVLALSWPGVAGPAAAGGPTSVLLSVPGEGRVAALYYTDPAYGTLSDLVGVTDPGATPRSGPHETGDVVTLTWLIHDVQVWRVDRVNLDGQDAAWVETRQVLDEGSVWEAPASWHRADGRLSTLVTRLLPDRGSPASPAGSVLDDLTSEDVPAAGAADLVGAADPAPADLSGAPSPRSTPAWAAAGALVGAALATVIVRRRRPVRPTSVGEEPRSSDQLAWP